MNKLDNIVLDNGLNIYLYEDKRRHSTFFQLITLFGGATNDFMINKKKIHMQDGVAHILEHYVVECNKEGNFLEILGEAQMNTNASTYKNMTKFYFETVENVNLGINTLLKGIYNVDFSCEKLNKIKEPIYQEIKAKMDNKFYHSNLQILNNLFQNISYRTIGGSLEDVSKTTLDDLKLCYEAFYQPANQYIVVAGNFNRDEIVNTITNFYKNLKRKKVDCQIIKVKEDRKSIKKESIVYYPTAQEYLEISYKVDTSKLKPRKKLDLDFYLNIFFINYFGMSSKLYNEMVKEKIITGGISYGYNQLDDFFIINIGAYTDKTGEFKKRILKTMTQLDSFSEEIFELEKKDIIIGLILRDEKIVNMILPFVDNLVSFNYPYLDTVKDIEKMTFQAYKKAILDLDFSNYTIVRIKNPKK